MAAENARCLERAEQPGEASMRPRRMAAENRVSKVST